MVIPIIQLEYEMHQILKDNGIKNRVDIMSNHVYDYLKYKYNNIDYYYYNKDEKCIIIIFKK